MHAACLVHTACRNNFSRPATPGKVYHCSKFSPFVDNGSDHGLLESQSLRNGCITLSRLIHVNDFVSNLFMNFFRSWHDVLLFKHAWFDWLISWFYRSGSNQAWNLTQLSKIMWLFTVPYQSVTFDVMSVWLTNGISPESPITFEC